MSGTQADLATAIASEAEIGEKAAEIRGTATTLTVKLFNELYPLLCQPIPSAFIQTVGNVKGKPYDSTGISSVQVQIDRMNNVLTPLWWWDETSFNGDGTVASVTVHVGDQEKRKTMVSRSSHGGVREAQVAGNTYKGAYTNAAKVAFARLGPGHEVYLGAADLDPDVNASIAAQSGKEATAPLNVTQGLVARAFRIDDARESLKLAAAHVAETDIGDCSTEEAAARALTILNLEQTEKLGAWLSRKETEAGVDATGLSEERVDQLMKGYEIAGPYLRGTTNELDGFNVLLGSLGINAFSPLKAVRDQMATLTEEQADQVDAELQKIGDQLAEPANAEVVEGGGEDGE